MTIFSGNSRAYKKFIAGVGAGMDRELVIREDKAIEFVNSTTQFAWMNFVAGWAAHPSFGNTYVSILCKVNDDGSLQFAEKPKVHWRFNKVTREIKRLTETYGGRFIKFQCNDPSFVLPFLAKVQPKEPQ